MKKIFAAILGLLISLNAGAQFTNGQVLTATALNNAIANPTITGGSINGVSIGNITPGTGTFTTLNATSLGITNGLGVASGGTGRTTLTNHGVLVGANSNPISQTAAGTSGQMFLGVTAGDPVWGGNPTITGGSIDGAPVGAGTPSTGAFTNLSSSGTVSGTGFSNYLASPPAIGSGTPGVGTFSSLTSTGTLTAASMSRVIASSTNVQNLTNNAVTTITTWTTTVNVGSNFNASTGVYTVPATGQYEIRAAFRATGAAIASGTQFNVGVTVNSTSTNTFQSGATYPAAATISCQGNISVILNLTSGDLVRVSIFQNSGGTLTTDGSASANWVMISRLY